MTCKEFFKLLSSISGKMLLFFETGSYYIAQTGLLNSGYSCLHNPSVGVTIHNWNLFLCMVEAGVWSHHSTVCEKDTVPLMYKATNLCDFSPLFLWSLCAFADTTLFTFTWVLTRNPRGPQCRSSLRNRLTELNKILAEVFELLKPEINLMSVTWGLLCHIQNIHPLI